MSSILKQIAVLIDTSPQFSMGATDGIGMLPNFILALPASSSNFSQNDLISGFFYLVIAILIYVVIRVWTSRQDES